MRAKQKIKGPEYEGSTRQASAVFTELEKELYWNDHPRARPANAGPPGPRYTPDEMTGLELRRYLTRIYRGRKRQSLAIGSLDAWARAIAYVTAKCGFAVSADAAARHAERVGIMIPDAIMDPVIAEVAAAKAAGVLNYSARLLGEMLQVTAAERDEFEVKRFIDACDESPEDRARRKKSERRAARGATPRSQSITATQPWIRDGYRTRRTWERNGKKPMMSQIGSATQTLNKEEETATEFATSPRFTTEFATFDGDENA